jgi:hypothetical protein
MDEADFALVSLTPGQRRPPWLDRKFPTNSAPDDRLCCAAEQTQ